MLKLEGVSKRFGNVLAVDELNLAIPAGCILGFLGPNGAGKTTTMRMVLDILRPDQGRITWKGRPIGEATRRRFGYLPEERGLYPKMGLAEQLLFFARLYGLGKAAASRAVDEGLASFGLAERRESRLEELSRGNQQKVQVLAAILHRPELVLLDEPFTGLDPANSELLEHALRALRAEGSTIMFSSHRLEQVEELCERVAIIARGRLCLAGDIEEIRCAAARRIVHVRLRGGRVPDLAGLPLEVLPAGRDYLRYALLGETDPYRVLAELAAREQVELLGLERPSIKEIFLELTAEPEGRGAATAESLWESRAEGGRP